MHTATLLSALKYDAGVLPKRSVPDGQSLRAADPAVLAITDFTREHPATVDAERHIDDALQDMIRAGVRALLVVSDQRVVGLLTSYDIQGERPLQFLQASNYSQHREIRVGHIMTPWHALTVIQWETVRTLCAGDLLQLLEDSGLTHLIVVDDEPPSSSCAIRALVSRARLRRQISGMLRVG